MFLVMAANFVHISVHFRWWELHNKLISGLADVIRSKNTQTIRTKTLSMGFVRLLLIGHGHSKTGSKPTLRQACNPYILVKSDEGLLFGTSIRSSVNSKFSMADTESSDNSRTSGNQPETLQKRLNHNNKTERVAVSFHEKSYLPVSWAKCTA